MSTLAPAPRGADAFTGTWLHARAGERVAAVTGRVGLLGDPAGIVTLAAELLDGVDVLKVFYADPVLVLPTRHTAVPAPDTHRAGPLGALAAIRRTVAGPPDPTDDPIAEAARRYRYAEVHDRWLRRQLTPHPQDPDVPAVHCDDFYATLRHPRCELITWPVATISEHGVRTSDGLEHHLDTLVLVEPS